MQSWRKMLAVLHYSNTLCLLTLYFAEISHCKLFLERGQKITFCFAESNHCKLFLQRRQNPSKMLTNEFLVNEVAGCWPDALLQMNSLCSVFKNSFIYILINYLLLCKIQEYAILLCKGNAHFFIHSFRTISQPFGI